MRTALTSVIFVTGRSGVGTIYKVTGVGFKPQMIVFFGSGDLLTTNDVARAPHRLHISTAIGPAARRACASWCDDAIDPTVSTNMLRRHTDASGILMINAAGGTGALDVISFDDDGYTLQITTALTSALLVNVFGLCIGNIDEKDSVFRAAVGSLQVPGATGNVAYTFPGFRPDFLMFLSIGLDSTPPASGSHPEITVGFATPTDQGTVCGFGHRGTTNRRRYGNSSECCSIIDETAFTVLDRAKLVSMDPTGFTLNWVAVNGTLPRYVFVLAVQGGKWKVGNFLTRTDTNDIVISDIGFQPAGFLFASVGKAEDVAGTDANDMKMSLGAADSALAMGCAAMLDLNGVNPTQVTRGQRVDNVYERIADAGGADEGLMKIKSIQNNGFTMVMSTADPNQAFVLYAAMGSIPRAKNQSEFTPAASPMAVNAPVQVKAAVAVVADP